jgi:hypothetical protein
VADEIRVDHPSDEPQKPQIARRTPLRRPAAPDMQQSRRFPDSALAFTLRLSFQALQMFRIEYPVIGPDL